MNTELVIDVRAEEVVIALLKDTRLAELTTEKTSAKFAVGDIYYGRVKKIMPGLNAAFVNIGYEKDAFLHYLDLSPQFNSLNSYIKQCIARKGMPVSKLKLEPEINKNGKISDVLSVGQYVAVQVAKEPISTKGPRLTSELSLAGRHLVLMPFAEKVSVSQKIKSSEERKRLKRLIESIRPKNYGVIVRTVAEGKNAELFDSELTELVERFESAFKHLREIEPPKLILGEIDRTSAMLRDILNPSFENIYVNNAEIFDQIQHYVTLIAADKKEIVKLYAEDTPIFDHFNITRQIKTSFGKTVSFKSGAYIIIESTEALHVIDVNSGNRSKNSTNQESNALDVNLRAADEIARQLRLRDMGGIIVIDFIDMAQADHRQALYEHMKEVMANDRARHNILPLSKFGLMQITRQRVRPALDIATAEACPSCGGKGEVQPSLLFTDMLKDKIHYLIHSLKVVNFTMYVHPFVDAYLKKGLLSEYRRWRIEFGRKFRILPDQSLAYLEYKVFDHDKNEIDLKEDKDTSTSTKKESRAKNVKDE